MGSQQGVFETVGTAWRGATVAAAVFVLALAAGAPARAGVFNFAVVQEQAKALAEKPYQKPDDDLPALLKDLKHDQYREIKYKPEARIWAGAKTAFNVGLLMRGNAYRDSVRINEVDAAGVHPLGFNPDEFTYGDLSLDPQAVAKAGFSGFTLYFRAPPRARSAAAGSDSMGDKVMAFQGASFFHGLVKGQTPRAGAEARGLAIDTGLMSGEEFPRFTEFWLERPANGDQSMVVDALLDSRRATGAYRFTIYPGAPMRVEVRARIYLRDYVSVLGLAPLQSMYFYGENDHAHDPHDYRPEVHDSDGLQIQSGTGEWIWRPLVNPTRLLATSFAMTNPQGFGLMQRDRDFADYQSLEPRYDRSPSVWVTPDGYWGAGRIQLVMLPTPDPTNNNVVAFWVPEDGLKPKQALDFGYRIEWQGGSATTRPPSSWVTQTRIYPVPVEKKPANVGFVVDFEGPALVALAPTDPVTAVVTSGNNGEVLEQTVVPNGATGGRRMLLKLKRTDEHKPVELRAYLRTSSGTVSETWSYILPGD